MIGPHEGKELELMLEGHKKVAYFGIEKGADYDAGDSGFEPHVKAGRILKKTFDAPHVEHRYYYLPTEGWRIKVMRLALKEFFSEASTLSRFDLDRMEGTLLGYSKDDIEHYISNLKKSYPSNSES